MKRNMEKLAFIGQNMQKISPVLLDRAIQSIQQHLLAGLPWLNSAFGRAYKITELLDNNKFTYPAVYTSDGEYASVLPNDNIGNFSWFDIYDPQRVVNISPRHNQLSVNGALVFWYDLTTIYSDNSCLYTEEVKNEIIKVLTSNILPNTGKIEIDEIYEHFENIYRGYSIETVDRQYFMYPYTGLRIEFTLILKELC